MFISLIVQAQSDLKLWYDKPATHWNSALPLGNGRIGAMVYGSPTDEEFQLNEETISKGSPYDNYRTTAFANLKAIRDYVFAERSDLAQALADSLMMFDRSKGKGAEYQPAGSLRIRFSDHEGYTNYRRELDLQQAISRVTYDVKGVRYTEEAFTSYIDQLFVVRYTASQKGKLNFNASLTYPTENVSKRIDAGNTLVLTGTTEASGRVVPGRLQFRVDAYVKNKGGNIREEGNELKVQGATEVIIYVAIGTNFVNYQDISGNPDERISRDMSNANKKYEKAIAEHVAFYQKQFDRVSLSLGKSEYEDKPTDQRIKDFATSNDLGLVVTYFQFGRYLMISGSQPGGQPMNLQGIWNGKIRPPWRCRYTLNINAEMNYWPAEPCNLPEHHEPFIQMAKELSQKGQTTARIMYGCRGWVTHHNTDLWRMTGAVDNAYSGAWPMGGAWICQHLWQKYLFNGDAEYLRSVFPVMKGAAQFFVDYLITDPRTGYKVVCPSVSPENSPKLYRRGQNIFAGITMDNQLVADLFTNTAAAARLLGEDVLLADTLLELRNQLTPLRIGRHGQLQEWAEDWDNPEDHHRHVSHLWALYPGNSISSTRSKKAFEAVKTSLNQRGDVSTGWSMGWKVCLWARCLDGNHAYRLIKNQLSLVPDERENGSPGGTYANMFDAHPPFQIDGNFGCTAGISEMLVQSHDGFVNLLAALPDDWREGEIRGLRTIGGFVIEKLKWNDGKLTEAHIRSTLGGNLRVQTPEAAVSTSHQLKQAYGTNPNPLFAVYTMPVEEKKDELYVPLTVGKCNFENHVYDISTRPGELVVIRLE